AATMAGTTANRSVASRITSAVRQEARNRGWIRDQAGRVTIVKASSPGQGFGSRHRFGVLFAALLVFFVVVPVVHEAREALHPSAPPFMEGVLFIFVLVGVIVPLSTGRASKALAVGLGFPLVVLVAVRVITELAWVTPLLHLYAIFFLGHAIAVILRFTLV